MGQALLQFVAQRAELTLVGEVDVGGDLGAVVADRKPDVVVDFSRPEARMKTVETALRGGAAIVVGTTGFTPEDRARIEGWVRETGKGCFIAPNFQVGNVLMQQFARMAARYFEYAEIIEYHHETKVDYPSGTAVRTAELMAEARDAFNGGTHDRVATVEGARGGAVSGIRVHAVRMPGFVASQEVLLGAPGQYLTIRHDSIDRASYMPGVLMAMQHIVARAELVYGLETILDL
jgi:4-hydroxy-tetrahydrodipicolinate reductase